MRLICSALKLHRVIEQFRLAGKSIGFVPTMGALHNGHLSLILRAVKENDISIVSIFVNPKQFALGEDLNRYPRSLNRDLSLCRRAGVDLVFLPAESEIYPRGFRSFVTVEGLSEQLCGATRPGHFRGVATVVLKLLNIVSPHIAYFGQKDAQQAIIIARMVKDFNLPVKIKVLATVREKDGLALSSRNVYLTQAQKAVAAAVLFGALMLARHLIDDGERDCRIIIARMRRLIKLKKEAKIDYVKIVDLDGLKPLKRISRRCLVALAVRIGRARLIDNIIVSP